MGLPTCWTRPSRITATRSPRTNASSWSCVTKTDVMPTSRSSAEISVRTRTRRVVSSPVKGSSNRRTRGRGASARASATRCA